MYKDRILKILQQPPKNYEEAKRQAIEIDSLFSFQIEKVEAKIQNKYPNYQKIEDKQFWVGLGIQESQTPYSEILEMIRVLGPKAGDHWIDLGAGYGRMGLTLGLTVPGVVFSGYEAIPERVDHGMEILSQLENPCLNLYCRDIASPQFQLPFAEIYFIYDFGSKKDIFCILEKIRINAIQQKVKVIARGRGIKNWIFSDCPWLYSNKSPADFGNWILFESE